MAEFQSLLSYAPNQFRGCKRLCEELADNLNSMPSADSQDASFLEDQLLAGLQELKLMDIQSGDPQVISQKIYDLNLIAGRRKSIR